MPELINTFEGGVDGVDIASNMSIGGGNAFDVVNSDIDPAPVRVIKYSSAGPYEGTSCAKVRIGAGGGTGMRWDASLGAPTSFYGRFYFRSDATPTNGAAVIVSSRTSGGNFQGGILYHTDGKILIWNQAITIPVGGTGSYSIVPTVWHRIEFYIQCATSVSSYIIVRIYNDPISIVPVDIIDTSGTPWAMSSNNTGRLNFGAESNPANYPTSNPAQFIYFDKLYAGRTTGWYGSEVLPQPVIEVPSPPFW